MNPPSLSEQLRAFIVASGHNPNSLADVAGVDRKQVARFMLNERDITLETASKIGKALNLRLAEHFTRQRKTS